MCQPGRPGHVAVIDASCRGRHHQRLAVCLARATLPLKSFLVGMTRIGGAGSHVVWKCFRTAVFESSSSD
jgi:hypothetical protein